MSSISEALAGLPGQFRLVESTYRPVLDTAVVTLLSPNPLRWAFLLSVSTNGVNSGKIKYASTVPTNPALGIGLPVICDDTVLSYDFRRYGSLVQAAWYTAEVGTIAVTGWTVIEVIIQQ